MAGPTSPSSRRHPAPGLDPETVAAVATAIGQVTAVVSLSDIEAIDIETVDAESVQQKINALVTQWNVLWKVKASIEISRFRPLLPGYLESISRVTTVQPTPRLSPRQAMLILIVVVIVIAWQYEGKMPPEMQDVVRHVVDAIGAIGGAIAVMDKIRGQNRNR